VLTGAGSAAAFGWVVTAAAAVSAGPVARLGAPSASTLAPILLMRLVGAPFERLASGSSSDH
jgi:hypothetical protein